MFKNDCNSAIRHSSFLIRHSHSGQVALYLVAVLVAICVLTMMNVGIYLSVSAKNRMTNAGDAAALAVANYQGELLNKIGQLNIDHLKAALDDDDAQCQEIMTNQVRCCFLGPISGADSGNPNYMYGGISAGNIAAKENGAERQPEIEKFLREHAMDIRQYYAPYPESYPEPWEGAWEEYAQALECAANAGIWAGPDNVNFIDAEGRHMLLYKQFYNAVAGRSWCWFLLNTCLLLERYTGFRYWDPLPSADEMTRWRRRVNSEVYSLNLRWITGSAVDVLGTNLICRLTDASVEEIENSRLISDPSHSWMFYDTSVWRKWAEIDPYGDAHFPVVGQVKPEYDVLGCSALCRVCGTGANLIGDEDENEFAWTAGAKPFGTVENADGETAAVTANRSFVTPAFSFARLVPIDSVGGNYISTADPDFLRHVHEHLPNYMMRGPTATDAVKCWYCKQLWTWEKASFRRAGLLWLLYHSSECKRECSCGFGGGCGGTPHGH